MKSPRPSAPQQRSRLNFVLLAVFALLLIIASVVLVLTIPKAQTLPTDSLTTDTTVAPLTGFDTTPVEAQQLYPFGAGVIKVAHDRAARLDMTGAEVYAVTLEMTAPFIVSKNSRLLVGDKDGHGFVVLSPEGEVCRGSTEALLRTAAIAPDGHFALITDPPDSTGVVKIYSPTGQWLFDCLFPDSGFVLSVAFTNDSQAFDVSLLNTDGSAVYPILKRLTLTGEATGQRILDDTRIYPLIVYDESQNPVLSGRTGLVAVSYEKSEPLYRLSLPAIRTVAGSDSGLVIVSSESTGGRLSLTVLSEGRQGKALDVGDGLTQLIVRDQLAILASGTRLSFVDLSGPRLIGEQQMGSEIIRIGFAGEHTVTVITRDGARQAAIPKK